MRLRKIRIQFQSSLNLIVSFFEIGPCLRIVLDLRSHIPVDASKCQVTLERTIIDLQSLEQGLFGVLVLFLSQIEFTKSEESIRCFRIEFHGSLKSLFSLFPLAQVHVGRSQH